MQETHEPKGILGYTRSSVFKLAQYLAVKVSAYWPLGSEDISGKVERFFSESQQCERTGGGRADLSLSHSDICINASGPSPGRGCQDSFLSLNTHSPSLVGGQACSDHDCQLSGLSCNQRLSRIPQTTTVSLAFGHHQLREGTTMMSSFLQAFVESWIPGSIKRNLQIFGDYCIIFFLLIIYLFYIPTTVSLPSSLPGPSLTASPCPSPSTPPLCSESGRLPMGVNKVCLVKLT